MVSTGGLQDQRIGAGAIPTLEVLKHDHGYLSAGRWLEVGCVSRKRLDRRQHKQQRVCRIQKRFHGLLTALLWERILPEFLDATASCFWNGKGEPEKSGTISGKHYVVVQKTTG